jgi:hypothetical protein
MYNDELETSLRIYILRGSRPLLSLEVLCR